MKIIKLSLDNSQLNQEANKVKKERNKKLKENKGKKKISSKSERFARLLLH